MGLLYFTVGYFSWSTEDMKIGSVTHDKVPTDYTDNVVVVLKTPKYDPLKIISLRNSEISYLGLQLF